MSRNAWISAGKISAAVAAVGLLIGVLFQGQAQQRNDMADVRAEIRGDMADVRAEIRGELAEFRTEIRGDIADVRAELRNGFAEVNGRFRQVNSRFDSIDRDLSNLRERVARIEGHLGLPADPGSQANSTP